MTVEILTHGMISSEPEIVYNVSDNISVSITDQINIMVTVEV